MLALPFALWKDRLFRFILGASGTGASALLGVVRNKWLAMHLEASGLGILAQTVSGQTWLGTLGSLGLGLPLARAVGASQGARDDAATRRVVSSALVLVAGASTVILAAGMALAAPISAALLGSRAHAGLIRIALLGAVGFAFQSVANGLFAGRSDLRANLSLVLSGSITAVAATILLVPRWGLSGGAVGAALLPIAGVTGALLLHRRAYRTTVFPLPRPALDRTVARGIVGVGAATLALSLTELGTLLTLRSHFLIGHGTAANGLLQAALALSQQMGAFFYAYLSSYAFGKIGASPETEHVRRYTRRQWVPLILLAAGAIAVAMVASTPLLHLLYSSRFDPARPWMAWALFGEFCRVAMNAWALGALPLGGTRLWLPIALAPTAGLTVSYAALTAMGLGAERFAYSYACGNALALGFAAVTMARRGVTPTPRGLLTAGAAIAALGTLAAWVAH